MTFGLYRFEATSETENHAPCQCAFDAINRSMDDLSHIFCIKFGVEFRDIQ
jgi:hypothetical protein